MQRTFQRQSHRSFSGRRRGALAAAFLSAATLALLVGSIASGASVTPKLNTAHKATTIKPDFSYYAGKTITFYAPIGNSQSQAIIWANFIGPYLHATVNIVPVANSFIATDDAAAAPPNGLSISPATTLSFLDGFYQNASGINFNVRKIKWVWGIPFASFFEVSCTNSPYHTLAQVLSSTTPVTVLTNNSGAMPVLQYLMYQAYSTPTKIITGFNGTTQAAGCEGGLGDVGIEPISTLENASLNGLVPGITPLALLQKIASGSSSAFLNSDEPLLLNYLEKNPPKSKAGKKEAAVVENLLATGLQGVFTSPGTPANEVLALTDAFKASSKSPTLIQGFLNLGINPALTYLPKVLSTAITVGIQRQKLIAGYLHRATASGP